MSTYRLIMHVDYGPVSVFQAFVFNSRNALKTMCRLLFLPVIMLLTRGNKDGTHFIRTNVHRVDSYFLHPTMLT